jgi:uncharacterized protein (UPF0335 family)
MTREELVRRVERLRREKERATGVVQSLEQELRDMGYASEQEAKDHVKRLRKQLQRKESEVETVQNEWLESYEGLV